MRKIHMNDIIKVKLSDLGKDIYYHQYDDINKEYGKGKILVNPKMPEVDKHGRTSFSLWEFIQLYGKHINMTGPYPIDPLVIWWDDDNSIIK